MDMKFFQMLELINNRLTNIEKNIARLDEKVDFSISLQRNHLVRVKNGQDIDDSMILMGKPYNDLSPQRAFQVYSDKNSDFIMLDVCSKSHKQNERIAGSIHIPLEELESRYNEIHSKSVPILIISEKGIRSILACEMLVKKGYFNVNNISGGYQFWPAFAQKDLNHR